jgi:hypothetical protein
MKTGSTHEVGPRRPRWRTVAATTGALAAAVLTAAGCGGAPGAASPAASSNSGLLAYSQCMRSHGVANFPDPNSQGVIEGKSASGSGGDAINPNSSVYQAAQEACQKYVSGGTTPADQKQQLNQALEYSACMRSHGVTQFPDPTVVNGQITFAGSDGVGRSPDYQSANGACQHYLSAGAGS